MIRVPRFGGPSDPAFILTGEKPKPGAEPRDELGRMLTADPQFARATVNLFWARLMGFGIVEPFDEFDLARLDPKTAGGLAAAGVASGTAGALANDFRAHGYSLRHLFGTICQFERLSAFGALRWRVEGLLHQVLRAQIRPHAGRRGAARCDRAGHQPAGQLQVRRRTKWACRCS